MAGGGKLEYPRTAASVLIGKPARGGPSEIDQIDRLLITIYRPLTFSRSSAAAPQVAAAVDFAAFRTCGANVTAREIMR